MAGILQYRADMAVKLRRFRETAEDIDLRNRGGGLLERAESRADLLAELEEEFGFELLGAFLGTEAASSLGMYAAKVATFQAFGALPMAVLLQGLIVGATLMAGSFLGRVVVLRLSSAAYRSLVDGLMAVSGVSLLWAALR